MFSEMVAVIDPVEVEVDRGNQDRADPRCRVSSVASRSATPASSVSPSAWPPGWSQRPQLGVEEHEHPLPRRVDDQR